MARVAQGVTCSDQDRKELERLSNSRTGEARVWLNAPTSCWRVLRDSATTK